MTKTYGISLHLFRRDLRLQDNTALQEALAQSEQVIPCFILDKRQIEENDYLGEHILQFMHASLQDLDEDLRSKGSGLYCFYGKTEEVLKTLLASMPITAIFMNRDYTPFSRERDQLIEELCNNNKVQLHQFGDALLHEPEDVMKKDGTPYTVYTPFYKFSSTLPVDEPRQNKFQNYYDQPVAGADIKNLKKIKFNFNPNLLVAGGRKEGRALLKKAVQLKDYEHARDFPAVDGTSHLSAHFKFGTISIREAYAVVSKYLGKSHTLIREFYWRDFFTHIAFHFPRVFGGAFYQQYNKVEWSQSTKDFRAWCEGMTGFPIVDAGMRELNTTGYMHNRVRMIVASFLTKDLHIDWRWGEKYFAQKLTDYDPAVNNGNWQWAASTGCDAQPYFRIFNPWLQQLKFDPDCLYIKKWVPELARIPNKVIHELYKQDKELLTNYPRPMLDHKTESEKTKQMYKAARGD